MIHPVILCGGSGTRLWPLSRRSYPKQFAALAGERTLFQDCALRLSAPGFAPPAIMTAADFRFIVTEQLAACGIDPGAILIEPEAKNTAPAILAAALHLAASDPAALMLVAPSDHVISDAPGFRAAVEAGRAAALAGDLVAFGLPPERPETGYGYLELAAPSASDTATRVTRFVEKPHEEEASRMLASGQHLWNAGIFLFRADALIEAVMRHAADLLPPVHAALRAARPDLGFLRLDPATWAGIEPISIDYAVMERAGNLAAVAFPGPWSDLGGWDAVWRAGARDAEGVATTGAATAIGCRDTLLRSESEGLELVGIGLSGIVAVAMPDAVLVADRSRAQEVGAAVAALRARGAAAADTFPRSHRPWGWFESIAAGDRFQVKRINVHPGAALSLQTHERRAEHWVVVEGRARVTIGDQVREVGENESVYVPRGTRHRLENPGPAPMVLIEVQTGSYFGEDDIIRHDDAYARVNE